ERGPDQPVLEAAQRRPGDDRDRHDVELDAQDRVARRHGRLQQRADQRDGQPDVAVQSSLIGTWLTITKTVSTEAKSTYGSTVASWNMSVPCWRTWVTCPIAIPSGKMPPSPEVMTRSPGCISSPCGT